MLGSKMIEKSTISITNQQKDIKMHLMRPVPSAQERKKRYVAWENEARDHINIPPLTLQYFLYGIHVL